MGILAIGYGVVMLYRVQEFIFKVMSSLCNILATISGADLEILLGGWLLN